MKPELDARTLDAMRVMVKPSAHSYEAWHAAAKTLRAFLSQHDASTAAARDEELAWAMVLGAEDQASATDLEDYKRRYAAVWLRDLASARAARAHIAKEQAQ